MSSLEVVTAVRQVEALVAQREVRDLLISQRQRQTHPVVEGGIDDLVAGETPLAIRQCNMADLAAPALDEADDEDDRA